MPALMGVAVFTACSKSSDSIDEEEIKPITPVSDSDWQTVSSSGGTIEKGDLTLTFPSGTFSSDAKVAITETAGNRLVDSDVAASFYQVLVPREGVGKQSRVSLKIPDGTKNVRMVVLSPGWNRHTNTTRNVFCELQASVTDGTATATLPALSEDPDTNPYFYIGLLDDDGDETRAATRAASDYRFKVTRDVGWLEYYRNKDTYDKIEAYLNENVPIALQKLKDHGFPLPSVNIQYTVRFPKDKDEKECWGTWTPSHWSIYMSDIYINKEKLFQLMKEPNNTELRNQLQATLVHESAHAIHDLIFEPRSGRDMKAAGAEGDEWAMLDEAMGCWTEKFWGDMAVGGELGAKNLPLVMKELFPHELSYPACRAHGYGMSGFLEYLAKKSRNGDNSMVKLYRYQKGRTLRQALEKYVEEEGVAFFHHDAYYDFVLSALNNNLIQGVSTEDCFVSKKGITKTAGGELSDNAYNNGAVFQQFMISKDIVAQNPDQDIELSQEHSDITSYILYDTGSELKQLGKADISNPYTISVKNFCKLYGVDNPTRMTKAQSLYVVSLRNTFTKENDTKPCTVKLSLTEQEETDIKVTRIRSVRLDAEFKAQIKGSSYTDLAPVSFYNFKNNTYTVTQKNDVVHIEVDVHNTDTYYDTKKTMSFDITGFRGNLKGTRIENLKYDSHYEYFFTYGDQKDDYDRNRDVTIVSCVLNKIPPISTDSYVYNNTGVFSYGGKGVSAFDIDKYEHKVTTYYNDGKSETDEWEPLRSDNDEIKLSIEFEFEYGK